ncbi:hypothetical protein [Microbispora sp. NPDC049633]|uniref:hypothetical protein n=1 Tax=Microbispora sp. NPDC049633 TaxID=3154355 RepID=UPI00342EE22F
MAAAASRKSPRDHTGRQAEVLAAENAEELASRRGSISTLTEAPVAAEDAAEDGDVVFSDAVEVDQPMVRIRVNTDLPDLVIGYGNHYSLYRGQWYRVPKNVADVLEEKGYQYH